MDCQQVHEQLLEGRKPSRRARRHLQRCVACAAFQQRLEEAEEMIEASLPFAAPPSTTQQIVAAIPEAARELQLQAQARPSRRDIWTRQIMYTLLGLSIPLTFVLGWFLWRFVLTEVGPWIGRMADLLPLIPSALAYWGRRLGDLLAPVREAVLFVFSFLLLGLALEHLLRSTPMQAATENSTSQQ